MQQEPLEGRAQRARKEVLEVLERRAQQELQDPAEVERPERPELQDLAARKVLQEPQELLERLALRDHQDLVGVEQLEQLERRGRAWARCRARSVLLQPTAALHRARAGFISVRQAPCICASRVVAGPPFAGALSTICRAQRVRLVLEILTAALRSGLT